MILLLQHQRPDGEIDSYHLKPGRRYHIGRGSACEVRILDLKLSRKHCAIEFSDNEWKIIDLLSTNGCKLNGEQIVGTIPLQAGSRIEAGQTLLTVASLGAAPVSAPAHDTDTPSEDVSDDHTETTKPLQQESLPEDGTGRAAAEKQDDESNVWEPEPEVDPLNQTDALTPNRRTEDQRPPATKRPTPAAATKEPGTASRRANPEPRRPTAVFRSEDQTANAPPDTEVTQKLRQDTAALTAHAPDAVAPTAATPPPPPATTKPPTSEERAFYITVLGRRVGPLTRAAARELKARELRGSLTTADLEGYPLG
jgi:pSer/pThr/pTyr-binding forkhead associated (FHA) protein